MRSEGDQTHAMEVGEGEDVGASVPLSQSTTESECTASHIFLNAQFEVPNPAGSGDESTMIVKQHFDSKNHNPALIGRKGEPVKPQPGDYTYSGMHDHGPLPKPKEGGVFASLIGLCQEAKQSSDKYLTEVIEKEKQSRS